MKSVMTMIVKEYKAIIIDDEALARKALISLLKEHSDIRVVAEAGCVPEAINVILKNARTGKKGDGIVIIAPVDEVISIKTGGKENDDD